MLAKNWNDMCFSAAFWFKLSASNDSDIVGRILQNLTVLQQSVPKYKFHMCVHMSVG